jgi:acyl-CoA synthetase (AMP-forming)/AMP-acid ligase II
VALHMCNGPELAVSYFACFYAGAIAVPVNTRMKLAKIEYVLERSGASIYVGQSGFFQEVAELRMRCPNTRTILVEDGELWDPSDEVETAAISRRSSYIPPARRLTLRCRTHAGHFCTLLDRSGSPKMMSLR